MGNEDEKERRLKLDVRGRERNKAYTIRSQGASTNVYKSLQRPWCTFVCSFNIERRSSLKGKISQLKR